MLKLEVVLYSFCVIFIIKVTQTSTRQYSQCELFTELEKIHAVPEIEAAKWTCIAEILSKFNSNHQNGDMVNGFLGIFGIQAMFWCASDWDEIPCNVTCQKFVDDDITDDVKCVREVILKDYKYNFNTWSEYKSNNCSTKIHEIIKDCNDFKKPKAISSSFNENLISTSTVSTTLEPLSTKSTTISSTTSELEHASTEEPTTLGPTNTTDSTESAPEISTVTMETTEDIEELLTTLIPTNISQDSDKFMSPNDSTIKVPENLCAYIRDVHKKYSMEYEELKKHACIALNTLNCYKTGQTMCGSTTCDSLDIQIVPRKEHCDVVNQIFNKVAVHIYDNLNTTDLKISECNLELINLLNNWCNGLNNNKSLSSTSKTETTTISNEMRYTTVETVLLTTSTNGIETTTNPSEPSSSTDVKIGSSTIIGESIRETTTTSTVTTSTQSYNTSNSNYIIANINNLIEDPCKLIGTIAKTYNMTQPDLAIWSCVLRDLVKCETQCSIDCETVKHNGADDFAYCYELSYTIISILKEVKENFGQVITRLMLNNCTEEILPLLFLICPALSII